ncbi:hypothetical protein ONZ45_g4444 [Pleurotus djamor]|nr:hypothetical protein ONZ45_g4444 [Pleurotus djamor]
MDHNDLQEINALLEQDSDLREKIRDQVTIFDKKTRTIAGLLNKIHSTPSSEIPALLESVSPVLQSCQETTAAFAALVPPDQFWRWKDMWTHSLRTAVFSTTLVQYLSDGTLMSLPSVAASLGIKEEWAGRFILPAEDYLHGLISLVNELSRLAVNAVTMGQFDKPIAISLFVKEIFSGFTQLNLKNDTLRRRYDSLKYDIKKIEEVVYDVSLRKLSST